MVQSADMMMPELPHPLTRFALNGPIIESSEADAILAAIQSAILAEGDSARMFLLDSNSFFDMCARAGIDGERLRGALREALTMRGRHTLH